MRGYTSRTARAACIAALVALTGAAPAFATVELDQNAIVVAGPTSSGSVLLSFGTFKGAPPPLPSPAYSYLVQSATAGKTGYLDHLDVQLTRSDSGSLQQPPTQGTVNLSLYDGDLAAGTGNFIASRSIDVSTLALQWSVPISTEFALFDLRDAGFFLTSGQVFSFKVEFLSTAEITQTIVGTIGNVEIVTDPEWNAVPKYNDYAGGQANFGSSVYGIGQALNGDLGFRSFVDVQAGAVPEPASWALMIGGFALAGGALRRRKPGTLRFA